MPSLDIATANLPQATSANPAQERSGTNNVAAPSNLSIVAASESQMNDATLAAPANATAAAADLGTTTALANDHDLHKSNTSDTGTTSRADVSLNNTCVAKYLDKEAADNGIDLFGDNDVEEGDDNSAAPPTLPAVSNKVNFDELNTYSMTDLLATSYYDPEDPSQKPITMAIMGIGVPDFPLDIAEDPDIKLSIGRSKGALYNKVDIIPSSNKAKPHLQKEIYRRIITTTSQKGGGG